MHCDERWNGKTSQSSLRSTVVQAHLTTGKHAMPPNRFFSSTSFWWTKAFTSYTNKAQEYIFLITGALYLCAYWHKDRRVYMTVHYTHYTWTCFRHVTFCFHLKMKCCLLSYYWHSQRVLNTSPPKTNRNFSNIDKFSSAATWWYRRRAWFTVIPMLSYLETLSENNCHR